MIRRLYESDFDNSFKIFNSNSNFLNNVFAAHTPINKRSIDRVAVFVTIKKKHLADVIQNLVDPLVIRSIYKYPEYCILRE